MLNTTNYKFRKPESSDVVNINDFNYNADLLDKKLNEFEDGKVNKVKGKQLSTEDYTTQEKQKLFNIETETNRIKEQLNTSKYVSVILSKTEPQKPTFNTIWLEDRGENINISGNGVSILNAKHSKKEPDSELWLKDL